MTERFSASSAARHMSCPASANLDVAIPGWTPPIKDDTVGAKAEGTALHQMLEPVMNLSPVTLLHFAQVVQYVADLRATRKFNVLVEHEFVATWLPSQPRTTPDLVLYVKDEIHVIDFKWGRIPVQVINNAQLLFYAACAGELSPRAEGVTMHIVQPRAGIFEDWYADTTVISEFMHDAALTDAKLIAKDTTFGPSDHCTFCPANPHSRGDKGTPMCPAMMKILYPPLLDEDEMLALE